MVRKLTAASVNSAHPKGGFIDNAPAHHETLPTGPIAASGQGTEGSLLLFTPRNATSKWIDLLTGSYGYSHLAVDCGEVERSSGKRVMIEVTVGMGVHNAFQDEYGDRNFVRIPLKNVGVDFQKFCACVREKLGEKYDNEEALTSGLLHHPAKLICSDLATICLPTEIRIDIARHHQAGFIHPLSAARVYGRLNKEFRLFVSPNGFAEYFGAPKGGKLNSPDRLFEPVIPKKATTFRRFPYFWLFVLTAASILALAWIFYKRIGRYGSSPGKN
jgi:hypothetical protein